MTNEGTKFFDLTITKVTINCLDKCLDETRDQDQDSENTVSIVSRRDTDAKILLCKCQKSFGFGGFVPDPLTSGFCPWTPLATRWPLDPLIDSRYRACHDRLHC